MVPQECDDWPFLKQKQKTRKEREIGVLWELLCGDYIYFSCGRVITQFFTPFFGPLPKVWLHESTDRPFHSHGLLLLVNMKHMHP